MIRTVRLVDLEEGIYAELVIDMLAGPSCIYTRIAANIRLSNAFLPMILTSSLVIFHMDFVMPDSDAGRNNSEK